MNTHKIIEYKTFVSSSNRLGRNIVLCGGCFDVFHYGHLRFLTQASALGDYLILILESDEFIIKTKKKHPVHTQPQRAEILSHLDMVDLVITIPYFKSSDYDNLIQRISPHIIALTEGDPKEEMKRKQSEMVHAKLTVIQKEKGFSSSLFYNYETLSGT